MPFATQLQTAARGYAASIRKTLAAAEYSPADPAILAIAAERLAHCGGDLALAKGDTLSPSPSAIGRQVDSLLSLYSVALTEAGKPAAIAARLIRWAEFNEFNAAKHRQEEADDLANAAAYREQAKTWAAATETADGFARRAAANASCAHTAEQLAVKYRAQAAAHRDRNIEAALAGQKLVAA